MNSNKFYITKMIVLILVFGSSLLFSQVVMTVNSLADDENSYPWDDPDTELDESRDGICKDELGRCTLRAAIEESNNMEVPVELNFSVSGTITLMDFLYPYDRSHLTANLPIEITSSGPLHQDGGLEINDRTYISGFRFNNMFTAIIVDGKYNFVGDDFALAGGNSFTNCYIALEIDGDSNFVRNNYFGIDFTKTLGPNGIGILSYGNFNIIGGIANSDEVNTICGSTNVGISIVGGNRSFIQGNYIGTTPDGDLWLGNTQGVLISGSDSNSVFENVISGNNVEGIGIDGVPGDSYSMNTLIYKNIIGLDSSKSKAIPNGTGIVITNGVKNSTIKENIIAGNKLTGIHIFGQDQESKTTGLIITNNKVGINDKGIKFPNGQNGINIWGNVEDVTIGNNSSGNYLPNTIVGNQGYGIYVADQFGFYPSKITARKNLIYQNDSSNFFVSPLSNDGILPPYSLTFSNNTIAGIHDTPGAIIDIYKSNINEFPASAYEWLGSTTVGANGVFSYEILDPSIEAVSVTATTSDGNTTGFSFLELITDVDKAEDNIPTEFSLKQNYPNPFNPSTKIRYSIPNASSKSSMSDRTLVVLKVYDVLGNEVASLVNDEKSAGNYEVEFNASHLSSGIYFYRLDAGKFSSTKKIILLK